MKAALALVGVGGLLLSTGPAGAQATPAAVTSGAKSPVGTYDWFTSTGHDGALTINAGGTFGTSFKETGQWTSMKTSVALRVTDSGRGDLGCVFLGTFEATGIDSAKKPGVANCNGQAVTWYATLDTTASITNSTGVSTVGRPKTVNASPKVVGQYDLTYGGETADNMEINSDTTAGIEYFDGTETGYWVAKGKVVAVNITGNASKPCLWLGMLNKTGLDSAKKPGEFICSDASIGTWYATRRAT